MCSTLGAAVMCDSIFLEKQVGIRVPLKNGGKGLWIQWESVASSIGHLLVGVDVASLLLDPHQVGLHFGSAVPIGGQQAG